MVQSRGSAPTNLFDLDVIANLLAHARHETKLGDQANDFGGALVGLATSAALLCLLGLFGSVQQQRLLQVLDLYIVMLPKQRQVTLLSCHSTIPIPISQPASQSVKVSVSSH